MRSTSLAAVLILAMATHATVAGEVDPALLDYTPTDGLSASLVGIGSEKEGYQPLDAKQAAEQIIMLE